MKKFLILIITCLWMSISHAQFVKQADSYTKKQTDLDWYNCSFEEDGVYGAEVNKAYKFLKGKKIKKRPVVALIGTGVDIEHEDLKQAIWFNPKEKLNEKDDDQNGLIDDINGWNFLGGKDGQVVEKITREGEREFLRLKEKYGDYTFSDGKFFKSINGVSTQVVAPEDLDEYNYFKTIVQRESQLYPVYMRWRSAYTIKEYADKFKNQMDEKFPGHKHTFAEFKTCYDSLAGKDALSNVMFRVIAVGFRVYKVDDFDVVYDNFIKTGIERGQMKYERALENYGYDKRKEIVGDDYLNMQDDKYGNNVLLTSDAVVGTMLAGVVGGKRDNKLGGDGIMDQVELMTLRVNGGNEGEPYLKDVALAIRYAVDHKADVIMLPQQNTLYPEMQKKWIIEALHYAENKGVLVIVPTLELSRDMSKQVFFPNRWIDEKKELNNLLIVASSDKNGNPSINSNYGAKEVDLFAPGVSIYTTYMGDTYQIGSGTGLAAATVAGVAALVKGYYPTLNGAQIRDILIQSVTSRKGEEVEKGVMIKDKQVQELFLFEDLCLSGGILNAYGAVRLADQLVK